VDVRIGIVHSIKELDIVEAALAKDGAILWLTDRKGRQVGVPAGKIAYVEVDGPTSERRVGFGLS